MNGTSVSPVINFGAWPQFVQQICRCFQNSSDGRPAQPSRRERERERERERDCSRKREGETEREGDRGRQRGGRQTENVCVCVCVCVPSVHVTDDRQ